MKRARHEKSVYWKKCNMKRVQHGKKCNMKIVQHEQIIRRVYKNAETGNGPFVNWPSKLIVNVLVIIRLPETSSLALN